MNEATMSVLLNLVASLIWLAIGVLVTWAYRYLKEKAPIISVWNFDRHTKEVFLTVTNLAPQQAAEYSRPTTGIGELEAVSFARESLLTAYPTFSTRIHLVFSNRFPETGLSSDIISVGGAKYNEITRLFAREYDLPLDFTYEPVTVAIDKTTGKVYSPQLDGTNIIIDYGLITKMPNPFNPQRSVFLLRGAHTYAVAGCGRVLTLNYVSDLSRQVRRMKSQYWQALLLVKCVGSQVFPEIVTVKALNPDLFTKKISPN